MHVIKSNNFLVTDEKRYQEILANIVGEIKDHSYTDEEGIHHGFLVRGERVTEKFDDFYGEIQKILPEKEVCIVIDLYHDEEEDFVDGYASVLTKSNRNVIDLEEWALHMANVI